MLVVFVVKDLRLFDEYGFQFKIIFKEIISDYVMLNAVVINYELNLHLVNPYIISFNDYFVINALPINHFTFIIIRVVFIILELILHTPFYFLTFLFFFKKFIIYKKKKLLKKVILN